MHDEPMCRATIRDGVLTLNRWRPILHGCFEPAAGVAIADLTVLSPRELLVEWIVAGDDEEILLEWAQLVGYTRVWLPARLVELEASLVPDGAAEVECPTCGTVWSQGSPDFWANLRRLGYFPGSCLACGGSLPEWRATVRCVPDDSTYA